MVAVRVHILIKAGEFDPEVDTQAQEFPASSRVSA